MAGSDESDIDDPMEELSAEELKQLDPKKHARAQHNALERRRRDNIKDMYSNLGRTVADTSTERASRAQILRKAIESIEEKQIECRRKEAELAAIEAENAELERRCREMIEKRKAEMDLRGGAGTPNGASAFVAPPASH
ncbi:mxl-1 [Pristionchus pacificus]|nr:mxl-1 [Pristionchus pacificus]